jgi:hypothetical protein
VSYLSDGKYLDFGRQDLKSRIYRDADVVCLVCHGYVDVFAPDNSGLLLRSPRGFGTEVTLLLHHGAPYRFRDLPLRYIPPQIQPSEKYDIGSEEAELMTVGEVKIFFETQAQLVMLLGCSTAAAQILSGDIFGSLAYQWLGAGAASVLAHQWEADLTFVSEWMKQLVERSQDPEEILHLWGAITLLGALNAWVGPAEELINRNQNPCQSGKNFQILRIVNFVYWWQLPRV